MSKLLIAHGGAPTAVINASLYGAVQEARRSGRIDGILGADHGSGGILAERFHDLNALTDAELEAIRVSPASAIGTSRTRRASSSAQARESFTPLITVYSKVIMRFVFIV